MKLRYIEIYKPGFDLAGTARPGTGGTARVKSVPCRAGKKNLKSVPCRENFWAELGPASTRSATA